MFSFFSKKNQVIRTFSSNEKMFIITIINSLYSQYPKLKLELDLEALQYVAPNKIGGKNSFVFGINNDVWKKICDPRIDNYDIKNIRFKDKNESFFSVDLYLSEGLIIGYTLPVDINSVNFDSINVDHIWEKHFINEEYNEIENILELLSKDQLKKLNLTKNSFKIKIKNSIYYPIYDLEDGNYIAIEKNGSVYKITHDPLNANRIYDSITDFITEELS
jgi:hypothetical protein